MQPGSPALHAIRTNAPNANISLAGGSNFYSQLIGATIKDTGGTNIYYDQSLNTPVPNNNAFFEIALRELTYRAHMTMGGSVATKVARKKENALDFSGHFHF